MGITSWGSYSGDQFAAFVNMTSPTGVVANNETVTIPFPTTSLTGNYEYFDSKIKLALGAHARSSATPETVFDNIKEVQFQFGAQTIFTGYAYTTSYVKKNTYNSAVWRVGSGRQTVRTDTLFNNKNPTTKTVAISAVVLKNYGFMSSYESIGSGCA